MYLSGLGVELGLGGVTPVALGVEMGVELILEEVAVKEVLESYRERLTRGFLMRNLLLPLVGSVRGDLCSIRRGL